MNLFFFLFAPNYKVLGVSTKPEKSIKLRNPKKITEKTVPWKKPIKAIKILKKPTGSVWFWFYKPKIEKTKPNRTEPKPKKIKPNWKNRAKLVWTVFV